MSSEVYRISHETSGRANAEILRVGGPEYAFRFFEAQKWIDSIRVETDGKIDVEATAAVLDIPVRNEVYKYADGEESFAHGVITGLRPELGTEPLEIFLNPRKYQSEERRLTFGHEIGHFYLERVIGMINPTFEYDAKETFCELFGRNMLIPPEKIPDIDIVDVDAIKSLMEQFDASHMDVILQLMATGNLPFRIIMDTDDGYHKGKIPFYQNSVRRHYLCFACESGIPHPASGDFSESPKFDFTSAPWGETTRINNCGTMVTSKNDLDEFVALNKAYGRWTEEKEALLPKRRKWQLEHLPMYQKLLAETALSSTNRADSFEDDDIPF